MRNFRHIIPIILLFIYFFPATTIAQKNKKVVKEEKKEEISRCLTLNDLVGIVNISTDKDFDSIREFLYGKGYKWSGDTSTYSCSKKNIQLTYHSSDRFYDNEHWDYPAIVIFRSAEKLGNIVNANIYKNVCNASMRQDLDTNQYHPSSGGKLYHGLSTYNGKRCEYEVEYYEDSTVIRLTIKNIGEINEYVSKTVGDKEKIVRSKIDRAKDLCAAKMFNEAYAAIDSAMGIYAPMDSILYNVRLQVRTKQVNILYAKLIDAVNVRENTAEGISVCNEILTIDRQNDSIIELRDILMGNTKKEFQPYSKFNPSGYNITLASLENLINTEIKNGRSALKHILTLDFTFSTGQYNTTSGSLNLEIFEADGYTPINKSNISPQNDRLRRYVNSIANSSIIKPVSQHGLSINTEENLSCKIEWKCTDKIVKMIKGKKITSNNNLIPFIDTINREYLRNISPKTKKDTLPYKVIYTVTQWDKLCNGTSMTDLRVTNIKTSNKFSWMPSLVIPGLGTYTQGYHSSVIARALPFALFTGLAITGLVYENGKGKEIDRTAWGSGNNRFWENKNFGYIMGYTCLTIAATIYVNDLVESIIATSRNMKRSQRLRDAFEKSRNSIDMQTQDIRLGKK